VTTTRSVDGLPAGTVMSYTALSTGVVDEMGEEPGR
jgi:hypothetical protein